MAGKNMTHMEFIELAFERLRGMDKNGKVYPGLHTVYSGFNDAFRATFPNDNPVEATKALEEKGLITLRGCRGGSMLYIGDVIPDSKGGKALEKMGLG